MSQRTVANPDAARIDTHSGCPECDGTTYQDGHEVVCDDCGVIVDADWINYGPDWRSFEEDGPENSGIHVGSPWTPRLHDGGLSTKIGYSTDDSVDLKRQRSHNSQSRFRSKRERNLAFGLSEVQRLTSALGLARPVRDRACYLVRAAQDNGLFPGHALETMAAAAVAAACREQRVVRTLSEIAGKTIKEPATVRNRMLVLARDLDLALPTFRAVDHVSRLASDLGIDEQTTHEAMELAKRGTEAGVANGRAPSNVAAACIWIVDDYLRQVDVADAAGVTPTTIRNVRNELRDAGLC